MISVDYTQIASSIKFNTLYYFSLSQRPRPTVYKLIYILLGYTCQKNNEYSDKLIKFKSAQNYSLIFLSSIYQDSNYSSIPRVL